MKKPASRDALVEACLAAFCRAGTIELSLDQLAGAACTSKRMLVHYFGNRKNIEEAAMALLEQRLRSQFSPQAFPRRASAQRVLLALWKQTTAQSSRNVLLLVMDVNRRAWAGSARAKAFYSEQQRLWVDLLMKYLPDRAAVEQLLQLFQGAVLAYVVTGDPAPGRRSLLRWFRLQKRAG